MDKLTNILAFGYLIAISFQIHDEGFDTQTADDKFIDSGFFDIWNYLSQAEALWETKSQIAELACQDPRCKGPVYQTARLNNNNNQSTHNFCNREVTLSCDIFSSRSAYSGFQQLLLWISVSARGTQRTPRILPLR